MKRTPRRLGLIAIGTGGLAAMSALYVAGNEARAGLTPTITQNYCILGSGDGEAWTWRITDALGDLDGTPAPVTSSDAEDVRDEFVSSINATRIAAGQNYPIAAAVTIGTCDEGGGNYAFAVESAISQELRVSLPPASSGGPPGALQLVVGPDATASVTFNPEIWIPLPEPTGLAMFFSGGALLAALRRRSPRVSSSD